MRLLHFLKKKKKFFNDDQNATIVQRGIYTFEGPKASQSAHYYDIALYHGYSGDKNALALDAAHKFGAKLICKTGDGSPS